MFAWGLAPYSITIILSIMKFERFHELWTTLVTNREPSSGTTDEAMPLSNGVSEHTVNALIAVADGDHSDFEAANRLRQT